MSENKNSVKFNSSKAIAPLLDVYLRVPYNLFAPVVVSLPLLSLFICFITSVLFKFDTVNETDCGATNFIPSISAVTGTPPQCYLWRICIALHSTPRLVIAVMYYNYWHSFPAASPTKSKASGFYNFMVALNFVLNVIENMSLVGVTYISNVENYSVHEKIFVVFMVTSCCYMLATLVVYSLAQQYRRLTPLERKSHKLKKAFFATIMSCTAGLLFFFYKHRVLCEPNAFSWFSACEYGIAVTNMGFHLTAAYDFQGASFLATLPPLLTSTALHYPTLTTVDDHHGNGDISNQGQGRVKKHQ